MFNIKHILLILFCCLNINCFSTEMNSFRKAFCKIKIDSVCEADKDYGQKSIIEEEFGTSKISEIYKIKYKKLEEIKTLEKNDNKSKHYNELKRLVRNINLFLRKNSLLNRELETGKFHLGVIISAITGNKNFILKFENKEYLAKYQIKNLIKYMFDKKYISLLIKNNQKSILTESCKYSLNEKYPGLKKAILNQKRKTPYISVENFIKKIGKRHFKIEKNLDILDKKYFLEIETQNSIVM